MSSGFICVVACVRTSFPFKADNVPLYDYTTFCLSIHPQWALESLPPLASGNRLLWRWVVFSGWFRPVYILTGLFRKAIHMIQYFRKLRQAVGAVLGGDRLRVPHIKPCPVHMGLPQDAYSGIVCFIFLTGRGAKLCPVGRKCFQL